MSGPNFRKLTILLMMLVMVAVVLGFSYQYLFNSWKKKGPPVDKYEEIAQSLGWQSVEFTIDAPSIYKDRIKEKMGRLRILIQTRDKDGRYFQPFLEANVPSTYYPSKISLKISDFQVFGGRLNAFSPKDGDFLLTILDCSILPEFNCSPGTLDWGGFAYKRRFSNKNILVNGTLKFNSLAFDYYIPKFAPCSSRYHFLKPSTIYLKGSLEKEGRRRGQDKWYIAFVSYSFPAASFVHPDTQKLVTVEQYYVVEPTELSIKNAVHKIADRLANKIGTLGLFRCSQRDSPSICIREAVLDEVYLPERQVFFRGTPNDFYMHYWCDRPNVTLEFSSQI